MTKAEQLTAVAAQLSEEQIDALLYFAQSMAEGATYDSAPPEALASLQRGLEQIESGEVFALEELRERLTRAGKPRGQ